MSVELEFVIGRDNSQKIRLSDNSSGSWLTSDLQDLHRAILYISDMKIDSDEYPDAFTLDDNDGTITFKIGNVEGLVKGVYDSYLIIYRIAEPNGLRWKPNFKVRILSS